MECNICKGSCDGRLIVRDARIVQSLTVCGDCLNAYGNQDFDALTERLKEAHGV